MQFNSYSSLPTWVHFDQIDSELHRQTFKPVRKKNCIQLEFQILKSLKWNQDIVIKPADNCSAIVIMYT